MFASALTWCVLLGQPGSPELAVETVRDMLRGRPEESSYREFARIGERAFRAYEVILSDPKSTPREVTYVVCILIQVKADRSRFIAPALRLLADPHATNRMSGAQLLGQIGSERDAAPLAVLLSDENAITASAAAYAIANIGGERSLAALNVWLAAGNHRDNESLRRNVTKYRDDLRQRLEKERRPSH